MMKRHLLVCLPFALAACAPAESAPTAPGAEPETYQRTIVYLHGDAPPEVRVEAVAPRLAAPMLEEVGEGGEHVAQAAEALSRDTSCGGASLWAFDKVGLTGNEICFFGAGEVSLADFVRYSSGYISLSWAGAVRSYWAGSDTGRLVYYPSGATTPSCEEFFLGYRKQATALDCGKKANRLRLGADFWAETFGVSTAIPSSDPNPPDLYLDWGTGRIKAGGWDVDVTLPSGTTVMAVADNPGGVQSVEIAGGVTYSSPGTTSSGLVSRVSSDSASYPGTTYTRRTVSMTVQSSGSTTGYQLTAYAKNYYGVEVSTGTAYIHVSP